MLKQSDKKDIDILMKIWKDNNIRFQSFIESQYWIDKYIQSRDEFLKGKIYIYTEATEVLAFIVIDYNGRIQNIQVKPEIQREGIGEILIQKAKSEFQNLYVDVFERNYNAVLFFKAMGFRKSTEKVDDETQENVYSMLWNKTDSPSSTFIYFDNSISSDLINEFDKKSNVQFYNIHTFTHSDSNIFNINISNSLELKNGNVYISDYIDVRNKLNGIVKNETTVIFFDCNTDYSYLYNVIKDVINVRNSNLTIVMHKPFSVEGGKKTRIYEDVKNSFEDFNVVDVDYEAIGQNLNVSFKDAFDRRDEELLKMICNK
ncbi:MAG: GNAT family N-acetyltransferase [Clostridia bacterium]|nr:GNAT family N-acetyltransferase [Clostridia bacterium]